MTRHHPPQHPGTRPRGKALAMFVLLLPVLLGMVGLTVDGGLLMAVYRQTQNAADAAALAVAVDLKNGISTPTPQTRANNFVQGSSYNNMATATVTINIPPGAAAAAGHRTGSYVEAIVSYPYSTSFIQVLGVNSSQTITARAVAGWEPQSAGEGVMTLGKTGTGLTVSGGTTLKVNGSIQVNSTDGTKAADVSSSTVEANSVDVAGTVPSNELSNFKSYSGGASTLTQNTGDSAPDPLAGMSTPKQGDVGYPTNLINQGNVTATNGQTLSPGIYNSITINSASGVTLNPGIYIIMGGGLTIQGGSTVTGTGVMFYNTSSTYNSSTGVDGSNPHFGNVTFGSSPVTFTGLNNSSSPYNGMLLYEDRNTSNTSTITMSGDSGAANISGTVYGPNNALTVSGGGTWGAQFITQSATFSGGSTITVNYSGSNLGKAPFVFLVE